MIPLFARGYCGYALILLLPLIFYKGYKFSKEAFLIACFCFFYTTTKIVNGYEYTLSALIFDIIFPLIAYQSGCYLTAKTKYVGSPIIILTIMSIFMAIPAIYYNVLDTITSGQLINVARTVNADDNARSATGYGMMLSIMNGSIAVLLLHPKLKFDKIQKNILIFFSLGALFSTIHLLNRTGIVLGGFGIATAILLTAKSKKNVFKLAFLSILIIITLIYLFKDTPFISQAIDIYSSRNDADASRPDHHYGGRTARWMAGLIQIINTPFGNLKGALLGKEYVYAHNMWIDASLMGSIFSGIILLGISFKGILTLIFIYKKKILCRFENNYLVIFSVTMFLQAAVEPVIEGCQQFFWMFLFWCGVMITTTNKYLNKY